MLVLLVSCSSCKKEYDYSDYTSIFKLANPTLISFTKGWCEDSGATLFFEFEIENIDYEKFSKTLKFHGYTSKQMRDGQFGSWEAFNTKEKVVYGQSRETDFGTTYYYFEASSKRLTAIARYTSGR